MAQAHERTGETSGVAARVDAEKAERRWSFPALPRSRDASGGRAAPRPAAPRPAAPPAPAKNRVPKIAESLSDLDAASEALEKAQRGSRQATLDFLERGMAVRRNADRSDEKRRILEKALAERGLRARASDRSEFTRIVKCAEQRCSLSSALRSIYVAALEHAYARDIEAEDVPEFIKGQGGLNKCAAAHRASRRGNGNGGAARVDVMARAEAAAKDRPSLRMPAVPPDESADVVVLLLVRDRKQAGYWKPVAHKAADERMTRALLPSRR